MPIKTKASSTTPRSPLSHAQFVRQPQAAESTDADSFQTVIASLTEQLRRENEQIAELMERQKVLRQQLLNAQERSLAALRQQRR